LQAGVFEITMKQMHHGARPVGRVETLGEQTLPMPNKGFDTVPRGKGWQTVMQAVSGPRYMARIVDPSPQFADLGVAKAERQPKH
jgi:hypothetical protein